jgi:hypothetical protein
MPPAGVKMAISTLSFASTTAMRAPAMRERQPPRIVGGPSHHGLALTPEYQVIFIGFKSARLA